MISKRLYLLLTGSLILLSVGTGFAMQQRQSPGVIAVQALERADFQLGRDSHISPAKRHRAQELVRMAMKELEISR